LEIRTVTRLVVGALILLAVADARAQTCRETLGEERSDVLVDQCLAVSPATHPPCNALNACELIRGEVKRGCGMLEEKDQPLFCKPYLAGADFVPPTPARKKPGFDCAKAKSPVETTICGDDDLADLDRRMSEAFAVRLKSGGDTAALRASQRGFVQEREHCADPEPRRTKRDQRRIIGNCIYDLTVARLDELTAGNDDKWAVFSGGDTPDRTCTVRFGHDGSDAIEFDYRRGTAASTALHFDEFVFREAPLLQAGDTGSFAVDGTAFPASVEIPKDPDNDSPSIVAAEPRAALMHALAAGRILRVKRNGKAIFHATLASFAAADAQARRDCGGTAK
jgi:uncharacterized protein YecT (DUF1311 family)